MAAVPKQPEALHALLTQQDWGAAALLILETYGEELRGFLQVLQWDRDEAADVYSAFCHDLLAGLPKLRDLIKLRAWLYALLRHASARHGRGVVHRGRVRLSDVPGIDQLPAPVRSQTRSFLRSSARSRAEQMRARLQPEERQLLSLRVDRQLSWDELALAMSDGRAVTPRRVAALRKRFERVKAKLRRWYEEERQNAASAS